MLVSKARALCLTLGHKQTLEAKPSSLSLDGTAFAGTRETELKMQNWVVGGGGGQA